MPVLGLAIKSAQQIDIARTLGRVYLGRDASEQVLRGRISRGVTERINAVLWYSDLRGSTGISESIGPDEIIPFLNDYAQAVIDAIHDAGGDVLKLIGDGVLAMFWGEDMADARRAALRAEHLFRKNVAALNARRAADGRPDHVGLYRPACRRGLLRQYRQRGPARFHGGGADRERGQPHRLDEPLGRSRAAGIGGVLQGPGSPPAAAISSPPAATRCAASAARRISTRSIRRSTPASR